MKLYATVKSERASKGQGGQEYIDIIVNDERGKNLSRLYVEIRDDEIHTELRRYSNGEKLIFSDELPTKKGKQQEGECPRCGEKDGKHSDDACQPYRGR